MFGVESAGFKGYGAWGATSINGNYKNTNNSQLLTIRIQITIVLKCSNKAQRYRLGFQIELEQEGFRCFKSQSYLPRFSAFTCPWWQYKRPNNTHSTAGGYIIIA